MSIELGTEKQMCTMHQSSVYIKWLVRKSHVLDFPVMVLKYTYKTSISDSAIDSHGRRDPECDQSYSQDSGRLGADSNQFLFLTPRLHSFQWRVRISNDLRWTIRSNSHTILIKGLENRWTRQFRFREIQKIVPKIYFLLRYQVVRAGVLSGLFMTINVLNLSVRQNWQSARNMKSYT